ncbi:MAG: winged helix DNA-binding protein [Spirochaetes bacterium]|nr:winged helix DNA-binding protein [Spirochaetota bacterium]
MKKSRVGSGRNSRRRWEARRAIARRRQVRAYDAELQHVVDTCPGYFLGKAYKKVTRIFEDEFRSSELTMPQFAVLVNTGISETATGSEIAERLGSDLSTISRIMDIVVRRGLVQQQRAEDRRVRVYRLTPEGRAVLDGALVKWKRAKRRVLTDIDRSSWQETIGTLERMAALPE